MTDGTVALHLILPLDPREVALMVTEDLVVFYPGSRIETFAGDRCLCRTDINIIGKCDRIIRSCNKEPAVMRDRYGRNFSGSVILKLCFGKCYRHIGNIISADNRNLRRADLRASDRSGDVGGSRLLAGHLAGLVYGQYCGIV